MQDVSLEIGDDGVGTIVPRLSSGLLSVVVVDGSEDIQGLIAFSSSGMVKATTASGIDVTTGVLSGTSGTDGKLTLSVDGGKIYVENRLGSSSNFHIVLNI